MENSLKPKKYNKPKNPINTREIRNINAFLSPGGIKFNNYLTI